jgi:lipoate-protein ligase A
MSSRGGSRWRYIDLYVNSYADATMCISPAIARARGEGLVPNTIAVFTHRRNSIVMGRQNDPEVDLDLEFCQRHDILVKRIPTPGTIFGDPGYIIAGLYVDKELLPSDIGEIFSMVLGAFADLLREIWGVESRYRPINDVEVLTGGLWKKIVPCSVSFFGHSVCVRVGLTVKPPPMDLIEGAMPPPPEKLRDKAVSSLSERMGCLEEAVGREIRMDEAKAIYPALLERLFDSFPEPHGLTDEEMAYDRELMNLYDNDEWFFANTVSRRFGEMPGGSILREYSEKIPNGPLIRARVLVKGGVILRASITGWFHGLSPLEAMELVEDSLSNCPADMDSINRRVEETFSAHGIRVGNATSGDIAQTLSLAVTQGKVLKRG